MGFMGKIKVCVDIWEGARLVGALKTKQINTKNKTKSVVVNRPSSWGLNNAVL